MNAKLVFGTEGPISVYEWSKLDLSAMLHRRPIVELIDDHGQPMNISMVCQMPRLILADGASLVGAGICGGIGQVLLTQSYRFGDASLIAPFEYTSMISPAARSHAVE